MKGWLGTCTPNTQIKWGIGEFHVLKPEMATFTLKGDAKTMDGKIAKTVE